MANIGHFASCQKSKNDLEWQKNLNNLFKTLRSISVVNMEHFQDGKHSHHARFHVAFCLLYEHLELGIEPLAGDLVQRVGEYDCCPDIPANGYRSLLKVIEKCCLRLLQLSRHITVNRDSLFFRSSFYCKELEAFVATLGQLRACLYYALKLVSLCEPGELFAIEENLNQPLAEELMMEVELLNQDCFYGRCLAFQFCESMHRPLQVVSLAMASFSDGYQETSGVMQFASSLLNSGKYILDPELRAKQVVHVTRTSDVNFCKSFWAITETEIMQQLPGLVCPTVQVNEVITLLPEVFEMPSQDGASMVTILPPCAHSGVGPVHIRLISHELREGQDPSDRFGFRSRNKNISPLSPSLVIHCHGGGFVSQSSKSHEVYLRHWARDLNVPIVSIDYSLAPEHPFPRALEECFYAYAWILNNCHRLGSTAEVICLCGDSAGANLMITTTLKALALGIRPADGIMAAYVPTLIRYSPSPSRLLTLMDPLLPVGILSRCLAAYAGVSDEIANDWSFTSTEGDVCAETAALFDYTGKGSANNPATRQQSLEGDWVYIGECDSRPLENDESGIHEASEASVVTEKLSEEPVVCAVCTEDQGVNSTPSSDCHTGNLVSSTSSNANPEYVIAEFYRSQDDKDGQCDNRSVNSSPDSGILTSGTSTPEQQQHISQHHKHNMSLDLQDLSTACMREKSNLSSPPTMTIPRTTSVPMFSAHKAPMFPMSGPLSPPVFAHDRHKAHSPLHVFRELPVVKNFYMSPLLAPDHLLQGLPPVYLVACHLDPILDDSVMFAKRLKALGKRVQLHVIDDLPHGFLNFALVNKEAKHASDICVAFIDAVLHLRD